MLNFDWLMEASAKLLIFIVFISLDSNKKKKYQSIFVCAERERERNDKICRQNYRKYAFFFI